MKMAYHCVCTTRFRTEEVLFLIVLSEFVFCRHPNGVPRLFLNDVFDFLVHFFGRVAGDYGREILAKLLLEFQRALITLLGLVLVHTLVPLEDGVDRLGLCGARREKHISIEMTHNTLARIYNNVDQR